MKLYYMNRTRATRPRWLLEEIGAEYDLETLDDDRRDAWMPDYRAHVHPLGRLPAFEDDGVVVIESAAICLYLADRFPAAGLAPPPGTIERATYYQWAFFVMTEIEPPLDLVSMHEVELPPEQRVPAVLPWARARFHQGAEIADRHLATRDYLLESGFSAVDVMLACLLAWADRRALVDDHVNLRRYAARLMARPAARRAFATDEPS